MCNIIIHGGRLSTILPMELGGRPGSYYITRPLPPGNSSNSLSPDLLVIEVSQYEDNLSTRELGLDIPM